MPKMFVHSSQGTYTPQARAEIARALTELGMTCERLADTEKVRSGVWVFFSEHGVGEIFTGGVSAEEPPVALVVNALVGGLDEDARKKMIADATHILCRHARHPEEPPPVYVAIHEIPEMDWGMHGTEVSLAALREG